MGFEPTTASLEGWNSTTELRPPILSTEYSVLRTEHPSHPAPLLSTRHSELTCFGGQARIRTLEDISQQIYSLPPLATWVPARNTLLVFPAPEIPEKFSRILSIHARKMHTSLSAHSSRFLNPED